MAKVKKMMDIVKYTQRSIARKLEGLLDAREASLAKAAKSESSRWAILDDLALTYAAEDAVRALQEMSEEIAEHEGQDDLRAVLTARLTRLAKYSNRQLRNGQRSNVSTSSGSNMIEWAKGRVWADMAEYAEDLLDGLSEAE
jgi:hypothetical protein